MKGSIIRDASGNPTGVIRGDIAATRVDEFVEISRLIGRDPTADRKARHFEGDRQAVFRHQPLLQNVELQRTDHATYCPYKGDCAYYSIAAGGERSVNAAWTYEAPYEAVAGLGRSSPDPSRVGGALDAERPDAGLRLLAAPIPGFCNRSMKRFDWRPGM